MDPADDELVTIDGRMISPPRSDDFETAAFDGFVLERGHVHRICIMKRVFFNVTMDSRLFGTKVAIFPIFFLFLSFYMHIFGMPIYHILELI